ncbi:ethanolamine ammonia-lyase subunit EutC [Mucilaginibacter sp.]|uniref:ethanolamine ammonia-lyase subunit EutC n=1 Tax=Mucilaginibacter sp. TaxID=1882438 RepID=UPI0035BC13DD
MDKITAPDNEPLNFLKEFTKARIAIGSTGTSIPTKQWLAFKMAHAHARDAVYSAMNSDVMAVQLAEFKLPVLQLHSRADSRPQYLQRPDMRRLLDGYSANRLADQVTGNDVAIVIADGLSAMAIHENVLALLRLLIPKLIATGLKMAPVSLVQQGRVAIADPIGDTLCARLSIILIGERPGLSAADSMGAYITYNPKPGLKDNARNCVSNIRPGGLPYKVAADKIFYLVQEAFKRRLTGVELKDNEGLLTQ